MSVNFGAGLAPAPNNPNADDAPPPQHPVAPPNAPPNAPMMGAAAPAASPLEAPVVDDTLANSTQPRLNARPSFSAAREKLGADWIRVENAIQQGDLKSVHRMLDEGLVPCIVEVDDDSDCLRYKQLPEKIFLHLQDIDLFDRFIDLLTRHAMQADLYRYTIQAGNGILLRRLVQSGVEGWRDVPSQLEGLMTSSIIRGDAKQLDACLQLTKEAYPTLKLTWNDIWLGSAESMAHLPSAEIVAVLIRYLKPFQLSNEYLAQMFYVAAEAGEHHLVSSMVAWLGGAIDTFVNSPFWREEQRKFLPETLAILLKGGFPQEAISLPSPEEPNAQALQIVLYGPQLSTSPFAKILVSEKGAPKKIINFIFCKGYCVAKGLFKGNFPEEARNARQSRIALNLFQNGLAAPLAIKLAQKMSDFLQLCKLSFVRYTHELAYLAYLNECLHPDGVDPLQDPLSVAQATNIRDASLAVIEEQLGGPVGFYGRVLACIESDGSVNDNKRLRIFRDSVGLPANIVAQIGATLNALCREIMASPVPLNLIKSGMTGTDLQAAFHRWIRQGVAQRLVEQLPRDLGLTIATHDWSDALEFNDSGDEEEVDLVALTQLISPVNYLITSVIRQYGRQLAEDIEANAIAMVEACLALPTDAFKQPAYGESELSSDDDDSSSSDT